MGEFVYEIVRGGNTIDQVYSLDAALERCKGKKTLRIERTARLYPHDYKDARVKNAPKEMKEIFWEDLIINGVFENNEQNTYRACPFVGHTWTCVAFDGKYDLYLRNDGQVFLVENEPKSK